MSKSMSGHFSGTSGTKSQLIQELKSKNIKFSEKDIQFITKDKNHIPKKCLPVLETHMLYGFGPFYL